MNLSKSVHLTKETFDLYILQSKMERMHDKNKSTSKQILKQAYSEALILESFDSLYLIVQEWMELLFELKDWNALLSLIKRVKSVSIKESHADAVEYFTCMESICMIHSGTIPQTIEFQGTFSIVFNAIYNFHLLVISFAFAHCLNI